MFCDQNETNLTFNRGFRWIAGSTSNDSILRPVVTADLELPDSNLPADMDPLFADLDSHPSPPSFVSYLVTNSICKLFVDVIFNHNTTFLNKGKKKNPAISFQFYRIYYSESYSIRKN